MKKIILLFLLAFILPTSLKAESYWLVIQTSAMQALSLEKIEMESMEQCKEQGKIFRESLSGTKKYVCLTDK